MAHSDLLERSAELGFRGFVRFDSLEPGQTILEKEGSYGLQLTDAAGLPKLEFFVLSGGERKTVLSTQVLAASTWYHFSAHLRSGQLRLHVGDSPLIDFGDTTGLIDVTSNPLTFGTSLQGDLDQLELYDFSRPPLAVFSNGQTSIDLTLDAEGKADTTLHSTGNFFASPIEGDPDAPIVPVWRSFRASDPRNEVFSSWFLIYGNQAINDCADGIASGENFAVSGIGCDFSIGLIPFVPLGQALRDVLVQATNFVQGKETHFVIGAFALLTLAAKRLAILRAISRVLESGRARFKGLYIEIFLAREATRVTREAAETGAAKLSPLAEIAGRPLTDDAARAFFDIAESVVNSVVAESLQSLGRKYGDNGLERIILVLGRAIQRSGINASILTRVILLLDKLNFPRLSDDAIEGVTIFLSRVIGPEPLKGVTRVPNILKHVQNSAPSREKQVLDNLFTWTNRPRP